MARLRSIFIRIGNLFGARRRERELAEELESHLQMHIEDNLRAGMSPAEARRQALIKLGGMDQTKEICRDRWTVRIINELAQDLRYGFRQFLRKPAFSLSIVVTLGVGIGLTATVFSVVHAVLLRPLPFKEAARLVLLQQQNPAKGLYNVTVNSADFADWKQENTLFEGMAAFVGSWDPVFGTGLQARPIHAALCTPEMFTLLNARAVLGRTFLPREGRPGGRRVVVLGYGFWRNQFAGNPGVVGRTITFNEYGNRRQYVIVGVMPPGFCFPYPLTREQPDVWGALTINAQVRQGRFLSVVGKLKPGVSVRRAAAQMQAISDRLESEYPKTGAGWKASVTPLYEYLVRNVRTLLLLLFGAAGFVLLIACSNVANLLVSRFEYRRREFAVRTALGCDRGRLARQLIVETFLVSGLGGLVGIGFAVVFLPLCVHLVPASFYVPRLADARINIPLLLFVLTASLLSALLISLLPLLQVSDLNLNRSLTVPQGMVTTKGFEHPSGPRLPSLMVVAGVAFAFVLLVGAGLMVRTLVAFSQTDFGFNTRNLLTMTVRVPNASYLDAQRRVTFFEGLLRRVNALSGVESAGGLVSFPPVHYPVSFHVEGGNVPLAATAGPLYAEVLTVTPRYFSALGMRVLKGRGIEGSDGLDSPRVAVINQAMARRFWQHADVVGNRLTIQWKGKKPWRVVGIVNNIKGFGFRDEPEPEIYIPFSQAPATSMSLMVRAKVDPRGLAGAISGAAWEIEKDARMENIMTMRQFLSASTSNSSFTTIMLLSFGGIALLLVVIGAYSQVSYHTSRRTQEIGIRVALGASEGSILKLLVGEGLALVAIGTAIGIGGAFALTRLLATLLYGIKPTDPVTFIAVSLILIAIALLACYIPARRAAKVDPMVALRYE